VARPRRQGTGSSGSQQLSHGQASYVLQRLIGDRRISAGEINRYISDMQREIDDLERKLQALREAAAGTGGAYGTGGSYGTGGGYAAGTGTSTGRRPGRPPGSGTGTGRRRGRPPGSGRRAAAAGSEAGIGTAVGGGRRRRRTAITAEQLASRQLQGRYLALIRQIPESRRGQYAKIAKERGREAAIKEMADVVKK